MRGYNESAAFRRDVVAITGRVQSEEEVRYYVRCKPTGDVTSGPFDYATAVDRALCNAAQYGCEYEVILPEVDEKGPRAYVADVVATCCP